MKKIELEKVFKLEYISYNFKDGYPSDDALFYECQKCLDVIASNVKENTECKCGNIFIDVSSARFVVEDEEKIKLLRVKK